ncbi:FGGY family carbohydrate kinase [Streptomyces sp. NPDC004539]|uniref:FGGY family carbohydrate kinase n=1 Tax=Streptomyces sp. NPDC004539 TaxID=3154280 RepID=UPI0033BC9D95
MGLAGHGDGLYAVDERGLPVRAAIVAMDTRAEPVLEEWRGTQIWSRALELSGTVPFAGSPAALLARHEPAVLQQARWLLSCKDWLRLTGAVATDPTDASASFTDLRRGGYSPDLIAGSYSINQVVSERPVADPRWQVRHFVRRGSG